jgi:hypothetical protein
MSFTQKIIIFFNDAHKGSGDNPEDGDTNPDGDDCNDLNIMLPFLMTQITTVTTGPSDNLSDSGTRNAGDGSETKQAMSSPPAILAGDLTLKQTLAMLDVTQKVPSGSLHSDKRVCSVLIQ